MVLVEVDHMDQMQVELGELGYSCGYEGRKYVPIHSKGKRFDEFPKKGNKDAWVRAADSVEEYFHHLEETGVAFVPKCKSNCRNIGKKLRPDADNDGCAIFWKASRFTLSKVDFIAFDDAKRNEGAVRVQLIGTPQYMAPE